MKKNVYYVIGGPMAYVSDQAGLNRGPLIQNRFIVTLHYNNTLFVGETGASCNKIN